MGGLGHTVRMGAKAILRPLLSQAVPKRHHALQLCQIGQNPGKGFPQNI